MSNRSVEFRSRTVVLLPSSVSGHRFCRSDTILDSIVLSGAPVPEKLNNLLLKVAHLACPIVWAPTWNYMISNLQHNAIIYEIHNFWWEYTSTEWHAIRGHFLSKLTTEHHAVHEYVMHYRIRRLRLWYLILLQQTCWWSYPHLQTGKEV